MSIWLTPAIAKKTHNVQLKRTILALYDGNKYPDPRDTFIHKMAHMPLNHLGLTLIYQDFNQPLLAMDLLANVRGILLWSQASKINHPEELFIWLNTTIDAGIRLVLWGNPAFLIDQHHQHLNPTTIEPLFNRLGLGYKNTYSELTYQAKVIKKNPTMVEFEHPLNGVLAGFGHYAVTNKKVESHLVLFDARKPDNNSHIVVTGPNGGFADGGYIQFVDNKTGRTRWRINPFEFFRLAYATDTLPKLDPTTLSNRRIYFSHIDGNGWRSRTKVHHYQKESATSAQVILKDILTRYQTPVTVAAIAGDLDPQWFGTPAHINTARKIFALPHVEVATHTYSHPNNWGALLHKVTSSSKQHRLYHQQPFSIELEVTDSLQYIKTLVPINKSVTMIQWSGDHKPDEIAIALSRENNLYNINGPAHNKIDRALFSYSMLAPFGIQIGQQYQIYSAATQVLSNESNHSLYTWLQHSEKTETPYRLKPLNLYYAMNMGQTFADLTILISIHDEIKNSTLIPITTSRYASIVEGFQQAQITQIRDNKWRIQDRGQLQTIRFDKATLKGIDFSASTGIIGQRHYQGSLYVLLDSAAAFPIVTLQPIKSAHYPPASQPYLIHSNWQISHMKVPTKHNIVFQAQGWGSGEMLWRMTKLGQYHIAITAQQQTLTERTIATDDHSVLSIKLPPIIAPIQIHIKPIAKTARAS